MPVAKNKQKFVTKKKYHSQKQIEVNDKNEMEVCHRKRNVSHKKKKKRNLVTKKKCQSKKINGSQ